MVPLHEVDVLPELLDLVQGANLKDASSCMRRPHPVSQ